MARRLLAAGDAERERIEQDIHDGVQTALRIRLTMATERFDAARATPSRSWRASVPRSTASLTSCETLRAASTRRCSPPKA